MILLKSYLKIISFTIGILHQCLTKFSLISNKTQSFSNITFEYKNNNQDVLFYTKLSEKQIMTSWHHEKVQKQFKQ